MTSEVIKILTIRTSDQLFELRTRSRDESTPLEFVIGAEAVEGLEKILLGIHRGDLEFITVRSAQLVRGLQRALSNRTLDEVTPIGSE